MLALVAAIFGDDQRPSLFSDFMPCLVLITCLGGCSFQNILHNVV